MTNAHMIPMDRTWTAIQASPRRWRSTIGAMFGVFGGSGDFMPVQFFVARNAESCAIINIGHQVGIIRDWLYMMGVQFALYAASLAGVVVSFVNRYSPFSKIALCLCALTGKRLAALPGGCALTRHGFTATRPGAIFSALIPAIELFTTMKALAGLWRIATRPANFRAILRSIGAVRFDFIGRAADDTVFSDGSLLHVQIIPHYCAVAIQRWVDITGGEPLLLTEINRDVEPEPV